MEYDLIKNATMMLIKKSTIDWCEENYIITELIAEFYNSITGLFLCTSAILFYKYELSKLKNQKLYFKLIYPVILLFFVGVGTIMFHGTLIYHYQLLDELPMLMIAFEYINIIKHNSINKKLYYSWLIIVSISGYINETLQVVIFQCSMTVTVIWCFIVFYNYHSHMQKYTTFFNKKLRLYYIISITLFVISFVIWNIENHFCEQVQQYNLHAWWHILTSIAIYYCNKIMVCYLQMQEIKKYKISPHM
jgi:dihydroceramidase